MAQPVVRSSLLTIDHGFTSQLYDTMLLHALLEEQFRNIPTGGNYLGGLFSPVFIGTDHLGLRLEPVIKRMPVLTTSGDVQKVCTLSYTLLYQLHPIDGMAGRWHGLGFIARRLSFRNHLFSVTPNTQNRHCRIRGLEKR